MELTPYNYLHPAKWTLPRMFILKTNLSKLGIHSKMGNFLFCSKWFFSFYSLFESLDSFQRPIGRKPQKIGQLFSISFLKINFEIKSLRFLKFNQKLKKLNFCWILCCSQLVSLSLSASLSQTLSLIHIPKNSLSVSLSRTHTKSLTLSLSLFALSLTQIHSALYTPSALTLSRSLT